MPIPHQAYFIGFLALGVALLVLSALTAIYIPPVLREMPNRVLVGLLAAAGTLTSILVIARCLGRLEDSTDAPDEIHIPGMDVEVEEPKKTPQ